MNRLQGKSRTAVSATEPSDETFTETVARLRTVHRAASDLRRGIPVVLRAGEAMIAVLAAETAAPGSMAELAALAGDQLLLLLAPTRAAAVLRRPVEQAAAAVAVRVPDSLLAPETLRALADPSLTPIPPEHWATPFPCHPWPPPRWRWPSSPCCCRRCCGAVLRPGVAAELARRTWWCCRPPTCSPIPATSPPASPGRRRPGAAGRRARRAGDRLPQRGLRARPSGHRRRRARDGRGTPGAHPLRVFHRRPAGQPALRLRPATARRDPPHGRRGAGVLLYLAQEGRGIGLINKLRAYTLQDRGLDTLDANRALGWDADERNFMIAARMLQAMGLGHIRLLTNNPDKLAALAACGVDVVGREPHSFAPNGINDEYLATKAARFGHLLD